MVSKNMFEMSLSTFSKKEMKKIPLVSKTVDETNGEKEKIDLLKKSNQYKLRKQYPLKKPPIKNYSTNSYQPIMPRSKTFQQYHVVQSLIIIR